MSGHSKWHSIRHKKGKADAKRGKIFSKLAKAISVAVKEGGGPDPEMNFTLRLAIDKAKQANMPKDNIERAIERGAGVASDGAQMERAVYEGMGPGGCALMIEATTDNTNRTLASLKSIFNKTGGTFPAQVAWMFERKGVIYLDDVSSVKDKDAFELALIDAGAEDLEHDSAHLTITTAMEHLQQVVDAVKAAGLTPDKAGLEYVAKEELQLSAGDEEKLESLIELLDDDDDVSDVFTNAA